MASFLRKNTAVRICVGPFLDKTDGITPETSVTVTGCHITGILEDDDNTAANLIIDVDATPSGGDNDMIHVANDDAGYYDLELTAAQTNYNGRLKLSINNVGVHCPVFHEFMILPAMVFDSIVKGTDDLDVNAVKINDVATTSVATINANQGTTQPVNFTGTGASALAKSDMVDIAGAAVNTASAQIGSNVVTQANIDFGALQKASLNAATPASVVGAVGSIAANGIAATSIATGAITNAKFASGAIDAAAIASNAIAAAKIATGAITTAKFAAGAIDAAAIATGAITTAKFAAGAIDAAAIADGAIDAATFAAGAITATVIATDAIDADAIKADAITEIQAGLATATALASVKTDTGTTIPAAIAGVQSDTDNIQTRLPAALVTGKMDSVASVSGTMDANLVSIDGLATATQAAVLKLKQLDILNPAGAAMIVESESGDAISLICGTTASSAVMRLDATASELGTGIHIDEGHDGQGLEIKEIGIPRVLSSVGPSLADMLWAMSCKGDQVNFDRLTDSLEAISEDAGGGLTAQQVRDAMKLAPTSGSPAAGSVDAHLDTIETDTTTDIPAAITAGGTSIVANVKDTLLNKTVVARHANQKPEEYTAGTGGNAETVNTTIDVNGNIETESQA